MDQDYIKTLSDEEKAWLSKFNEEYYGNTIKPGSHHKGKKQKRALYRQTNERNRDIYNQGLRTSLDSSFAGTVGEENSVVDYVDFKKSAYIPKDDK